MHENLGAKYVLFLSRFLAALAILATLFFSASASEICFTAETIGGFSGKVPDKPPVPDMSAKPMEAVGVCYLDGDCHALFLLR